MPTSRLLINPEVKNFTETRRELTKVKYNFLRSPLNNLNASSAPQPDDDEGDGYQGGSLWYNTSTNILYVCEDATRGAADWQAVAGGGGIASDAFVTITPDSGGDIVADSVADTLILTGGTGVTTVGTPGTDTITFNTVDSEINHDALSNFVSNEHIDHTAVTLTLTQTTDETSVTSSGSPLDISASRSWTIGIADNPVLPGTGSVTVPIGTTAQQPGVPVNGMIRYDTDDALFKFRENGAWVNYSVLPASTSTWGNVLSDSPTGWDGHLIGEVIWTNIGWTEGRLAVTGGTSGTINAITAPSAANQLLVSQAASPKMAWTSTPTIGGNVTIGIGAAGVDYTLTFDGETNDGILTYKEDEDEFYFGNSHISLETGGKIIFDTDFASSAFIRRNVTGFIEYQSPSALGHKFQDNVEVATGNDFEVDDGVLYVDATNDRVGIKTSAPATTLQIIDEINTGVRGVSVELYHTSAVAPIISFKKARGTAGSASAVATSDQTGLFRFYGHDGTDLSTTPAAFGGIVDGAVSTGVVPMAIRFLTGSTNFGTEAVRITSNQEVLIGTSTRDASALMLMASTTKGFRLPSMTTTQRDAISSPIEGLMVWNTTTKSVQVHDGTSWADVP